MTDLFSSIPEGDLFGLKGKNGYDFRKTASFLGLNRRNIAKAAKISEQSVRYDERTPADLKDFFMKIISVICIVAKQFDYDKENTKLWFNMPNPMLGGVSPVQMIILGKYGKLMKFIQRSLDGDIAW